MVIKGRLSTFIWAFISYHLFNKEKQLIIKSSLKKYSNFFLLTSHNHLTTPLQGREFCHCSHLDIFTKHFMYLVHVCKMQPNRSRFYGNVTNIVIVVWEPHCFWYRNGNECICGFRFSRKCYRVALHNPVLLIFLCIRSVVALPYFPHSYIGSLWLDANSVK